MRPLRMRRIKWPMSKGWKRLHFWNPRPRYANSLYNFGCSTMNIIKRICENNARPVIKKTYEILRMREITWSVKGGLNVLLQSFSSTSIYRTGLQKLSISSHSRPFSLTFVLRMRRNGYLWTSGVNCDSAVRLADPDFRLECKISAIWRRFPLNFAFYMLNVRHISTSGLFDLLT